MDAEVGVARGTAGARLEAVVAAATSARLRASVGGPLPGVGEGVDAGGLP